MIAGDVVQRHEADIVTVTRVFRARIAEANEEFHADYLTRRSLKENNMCQALEIRLARYRLSVQSRQMYAFDQAHIQAIRASLKPDGSRCEHAASDR